ncbi:MAG: methyltransferase domain-containing protein [Candidatus Margulisiibacteriota bacterium]
MFNLFRNKQSDQKLIKVDIGCGDSKADGFIGVDIVPGPKVDIVCDLNVKFPFENSSVDYLRANHTIEHLHDKIKTMNEIFRVCRDNAIVDIWVPSTDGRGAFQDPTHVSYWNSHSFLYFTNKKPDFLAMGKKYGFKGEFKILKLRNSFTIDKIVFTHARLKAIKPAKIDL